MRRIEDITVQPFVRGVFTGWEREKYRNACGLNPSSIKQPSPKHVKWAYENQGETTDAMQLGTAVHTLVWEPDLFKKQVVAFEGTRRGKAWEEFRDEHSDCLILKADAYSHALAIGTSLTSDGRVRELAGEGIPETAVLTVEMDMQCRGLIDWIATHLGILVDLKVVRSINERRFGNAVQEYDWDLSAACYKRWFEREANKEIKAVKFIDVESKPPFDIAVDVVDAESLERKWTRAFSMIERVRESIDTGVWPGIAPEERALFVPTYAMDEEQVEWEDAA